MWSAVDADGEECPWYRVRDLLLNRLHRCPCMDCLRCSWPARHFREQSHQGVSALTMTSCSRAWKPCRLAIEKFEYDQSRQVRHFMSWNFVPVQRGVRLCDTHTD